MEDNIFIKQHLRREIVKQKEFENEQIPKICKFFANDRLCPDQYEFEDC